MSFDPKTYHEQKPALLDEVQLCPDVNGPELMRMAQRIEDSPLKLTMSTTMPQLDCGSAGCIIGFGKVFYALTQVKSGEWFNYSGPLAMRLGLNGKQRLELFFCADNGGPKYQDVTKEMAVSALRHLARTGKVRFDL